MRSEIFWVIAVWMAFVSNGLAFLNTRRELEALRTILEATQ
jgi:hypothetical protein